MSSGHDSSSEATESNEEAIAEGMMHLAIACDHVEQQSPPDAAAAGNAEAKMAVSDSSDDGMEETDKLVDRRAKRRKGSLSETVPRASTALSPANPSASTYSAPGWSWFPGQWLQQQGSQNAGPPPPPPPPAYPSQCPPVAAAASQESEDRAARRKRRQEYDGASHDRVQAGVKPNFVYVGKGGEVDSGCKGKNAWDEAVRDYTPKILDMSCTSWSKQDPYAIRKLREALDNEFEYKGQPLSMVGFRTAIVRYMKSEWNRVKTKWLKGDITCPAHINGTQWKRLIDYWETPAQRHKSLKMASARQNVKHQPLVGRLGKAGKEAVFREGRQTSPGLTDIAEGLNVTPGSAVVRTSAGAGEADLKEVVQSLKDEVDEKFNRVLDVTSGQAAALEDLRCMFQSYMGRKDSVEGSPSITQSALDNPDSLGLQDDNVVRRRKVVHGKSVAEKRRSKPKEKSTSAAAGTNLASKDAVTLSSDEELPTVPSRGARSPRWKVVGTSPSPPLCALESPSEVEALDESTLVLKPEAEDPYLAVSPKNTCSTEVPTSPSKAVEVQGGGDLQAPLGSAGCNIRKSLGLEVDDDSEIHVEGGHAMQVELAPEVPESAEAGDGAVQTACEDHAAKEKSPEPSSVVLPEEGALSVETPIVAPKPSLPVEGSKPQSSGEEDVDGVDLEVSPEVVSERIFEDASIDRAAAVDVAAAPSKKARKPPKSPSQGKTGKRETRSNPKPVAEKKRDGPMKKGFELGDEVFLMNPRAVRQKVASATVSGFPGQHKFHGKEIPKTWLKVDVRDVLQTGCALMFPNSAADMEVVEDAKGSSAIWDTKYISMPRR